MSTLLNSKSSSLTFYQRGAWVLHALRLEVGDEVEFDRVLLISDESGVKVGQPLVKGAKVLTRVEAIEKARKILVWKYRPKQRYRRRRGHRQTYMRLRIEKIVQ